MVINEPRKINKVVLHPLPVLENAAPAALVANSTAATSTVPTSVTTTSTAAVVAASMLPSAATTLTRGSNAYWIYCQYNDDVEKMESSKSPLKLALVMLKVLREIENDGERDPYEYGSSIVEAQCFFNVFNSSVPNRGTLILS